MRARFQEESLPAAPSVRRPAPVATRLRWRPHAVPSAVAATGRTGSGPLRSCRAGADRLAARRGRAAPQTPRHARWPGFAGFSCPVAGRRHRHPRCTTRPGARPRQARGYRCGGTGTAASYRYVAVKLRSWAWAWQALVFGIKNTILSHIDLLCNGSFIAAMPVAPGEKGILRWARRMVVAHVRPPEITAKVACYLMSTWKQYKKISNVHG